MDAAGWDRRYGTSDFVWTTEPNRFLPPEVADLPPGRAVDLACGEGRNAVWLATQGWRVTGVDFSAVGLAKGERLAHEHGVSVDWTCADATTWVAPEPVDLVAVFYLQLPGPGRRAALRNAAASLAPAGVLVVVAHDLANLDGGHGGPQDPAVLYRPDDVRADLDGTGLVVERARTAERPVTTADGERIALDCLVRARRPAG